MAGDNADRGRGEGAAEGDGGSRQKVVTQRHPIPRKGAREGDLSGLGYLDDPRLEKARGADPMLAWNILEAMRGKEPLDEDLAAEEHEAFYRMLMSGWTAPLAALGAPAAIPGYQMAKIYAQNPWAQPLLRMNPAAQTLLDVYGASGGTPPSWHQLGGGVSGMVKGAKDWFSPEGGR